MTTRNNLLTQLTIAVLAFVCQHAHVEAQTNGVATPPAYVPPGYSQSSAVGPSVSVTNVSAVPETSLSGQTVAVTRLPAPFGEPPFSGTDDQEAHLPFRAGILPAEEDPKSLPPRPGQGDLFSAPEPFLSGNSSSHAAPEFKGFGPTIQDITGDRDFPQTVPTTSLPIGPLATKIPAPKPQLTTTARSPAATRMAQVPPDSEQFDSARMSVGAAATTQGAAEHPAQCEEYSPFSPDPNYDCIPYMPQLETEIYQGKWCVPTQRPLVELWRPLYAAGEIPPSPDFLGRKNLDPSPLLVVWRLPDGGGL